jgi:hypothetical protein
MLDQYLTPRYRRIEANENEENADVINLTGGKDVIHEMTTTRCTGAR